MVLEEYKKKREFSKTSEPEGKPIARGPGRVSKQQKANFVVQEHHARDLHYDFRLELPFDIFSSEEPKGKIVLKSWAVPKVIPLEPGIKHLAIEVEDHPVDYIDFSGEIPAGQYGAGTVKIWDKGNFNLIHKTRNELEMELFGEKLKGTYVLIQTKMGGNPKNWLVFKK